MRIKPVILSLVIFICCSAVLRKDSIVRKSFAHAEAQARVMIKEVNTQLEKTKTENFSAGNKKPEPVGPRTLKAGELVLVPSRDWTSGFFAGVLWYLYE